MFIKYQQMQIE